MDGSIEKKRFQFIGQTLNVFNVKMTVPCNIDKSAKETNARPRSQHCSLIPNLPFLHHSLHTLLSQEEMSCNSLNLLKSAANRVPACLAGCLCDMGGWTTLFLFLRSGSIVDKRISERYHSRIEATTDEAINLL